MGQPLAMSFLRVSTLLHRYLGIAIGMVMSAWCLSGFVMMYVPFPSVSSQQQVKTLSPLSTAECCRVDSLPSQALVDVNRFVIEMHADRPILRINASNRKNPILDLRTGQVIPAFSKTELIQQSEGAYAFLFDPNDVVSTQWIDQDQWTVTNFYDVDRPLLKVSFIDDTALYFSSTRGHLAQLTTQTQRTWSWFGAIPHWLYPQLLRQHDKLWENVVIALSLLGVFLTVFGLYLGVVKYRRLPSGRHSPYRGVALWHHYVGLVFGLLVLTWVGSGLLSMNPWQLFQLGGGKLEREALTGVPLASSDVEQFIRRLPSLPIPENTKRLEGYALSGKLEILAVSDTGVQRLNAEDLSPNPLTSDEWQRLINKVSLERKIRHVDTLNEADGYYYNHHSTRYFPVQRVVLDDEQSTRLYLHGESGELVGYFDRDNRWYRWLFSGLHQMDFASWLRVRPVWDIVVWFLLIGVSIATLTGSYLGIKRLVRGRGKA
ncbi:hypothetical protein [Aurantivibrio plasticivorans]